MRGALGVVLALVASGCGFSAAGAPGDGKLPIDAPGGGDGAPDGVPDAPPDAVPCYGTLASYCLATVPPATTTFGASKAINTNAASADCSPAFANACVIAAQVIVVNAGVVLTASGTRPLVLVAEDALTVSGTLDVSSRRGATTGAAANGSCGTPSAPQPGAGDTGPQHTAGGGGAGGSFSNNGGDGGNGAGGKSGGNAAAAPTFGFRGGCRGETGAISGPGGTMNAGAGGDSGGVVYLIAGSTLSIGGAVYASGAGGGNGRTVGGGAGGAGSGGLVALEAMAIQVTGMIGANGGGGGGAAGITEGLAGADGANSTNTGTITWNTRAPGGGGSDGQTGDGGRGTDRATATGEAGTNASSGGGGGGGGGSPGVIWYKGTLSGAMLAPIPTLGS